MVDEMDLIRPLNDAARLRPEAYERARATLRAAMAESGPALFAASGAGPAPESARAGGEGAFRRRGRRRSLRKLGIGAGIGTLAAAAAAAVVLMATSTPPPAATAASGSATPVQSASRAPAVQSKLVSLAALIQASGGSLPGDASLVIRTQAETGIPVQVSYNLYADNGAFYGGGDKSSLRQAVDSKQNLSDGINAREVAAARYAAAGDLNTAREQMVNASPNDLGLGLSPAARQKIWDKDRAQTNEMLKEKGAKFRIPPNPPTGKALRAMEDNYVWNNSVDALSSGAGDPQVREGVLRLLSTISGVTVANSTTGGQPALTLTAGPEVFGGSGSEILMINAKTGMPVKAVMPGYANVPTSVQTFQVSRVTLADVAAGKF